MTPAFSAALRSPPPGRRCTSPWTPWLFLSPYLLLTLVFFAYPFFGAMHLAFFQTAGPHARAWVGLDNFSFILRDRDFHTAVINTVIFAVANAMILLPLSLGLALLLNSGRDRLRGFFRLVFFSPNVLGQIFVGIIFSVIFVPRYGLMNIFLQDLVGWGLEARWLQTPSMVMPAIIITNLWLYAGFNMVYFLAALQCVDESQVEAARIDGAGPFQVFWHVTLPAIKPVAIFVLVVSTINSFQLFELPFALLQGNNGNFKGPANSGYTIVGYLYDAAYGLGDLGLAAAVGWMLAFIILSVSVAQLKLTGSLRGGQRLCAMNLLSGRLLAAGAAPALAEPGSAAGINLIHGFLLGALAVAAVLSVFDSQRPRWLRRYLRFLLLGCMGILILAPLAWLYCSVFKKNDVLMAYSFLPPVSKWGETLGLDNFRRLFAPRVSLQGPIVFWQYLLNSLFLASSATIIQLFFCSLGGYALAKFRFNGRRQLMLFMLGSMMLPGVLFLAPLFELMFHLGWIDTYAALLVPGAATAFGIFLFRQAMQAVPDSLIEAARVDGAGEFFIYWRIIMPLVQPMTAAFCLIVFMGQWNAFISPQIYLQSTYKLTVPVVLSQFMTQYAEDYGMFLAGTALAILPVAILFLALQREFIAGLTSGAVKG